MSNGVHITTVFYSQPSCFHICISSSIIEFNIKECVDSLLKWYDRLLFNLYLVYASIWDLYQFIPFMPMTYTSYLFDSPFTKVLWLLYTFKNYIIMLCAIKPISLLLHFRKRLRLSLQKFAINIDRIFFALVWLRSANPIREI